MLKQTFFNLYSNNQLILSNIKKTKKFKQKIFKKIQLKLNQFKLIIYNTNIKQLINIPNHKYFSYLNQKIQNKTTNQIIKNHPITSYIYIYIFFI